MVVRMVRGGLTAWHVMLYYNRREDLCCAVHVGPLASFVVAMDVASFCGVRWYLPQVLLVRTWVRRVLCFCCWLRGIR